MYGKLFSRDLNTTIEFIPYIADYHDQTIEVIRKSFFKFETVCIGSEIDENLEAQKDLEVLCDDALKKSNVCVVARDTKLNKIVGVAINVIQNKLIETDHESYFEVIMNGCKTESAKCLMNYMIVADSKVDLFEKFQVNSSLEIMFLAVLQDYGHQGIGNDLCKHSIDIARKQGLKLVTSLFTGRNSQAIGRKLRFEIVFEESFKEFSFKGKTFAERVNDSALTYHVAAKAL